MSLPNAPDLVSKTIEGHVLTLTLGDPPAHPLSLAMIEALEQALLAARDDAGVKVVVLHGPGKIFCAGHDMKEIKAHRTNPDQGAAYTAVV